MNKLVGFLTFLLLIIYVLWIIDIWNEKPKVTVPIVVASSIKAKDTLCIKAGKYVEPGRPPVYIGIGPRGPPIHTVRFK